ncbi:hypothetical protein F5Y16DRAFT_422317 [Xylariaceae sp. FL0255]|nr:hypothetical protein F5Y16DRAFT_422317 [Xylariaceae sp. FL0255]
MSFDTKGPVSTTDFEIDPRDVHYQKYQKKIRLFNSARLGLIAVALLSGLIVLGNSANTLRVYNATHLPSEYYLPLWPNEFDRRPTVALVAGSAFVVFANIISVLFSRVKMLQNRTLIHNAVTLVAPFIGFVAALVGLTFFYTVNASSTVDTVQSWSCRWNYTNMTMQPHFGSLCSQSKAALYLSVILVPVELIALSVAVIEMAFERKAASMPIRKASSPALS